MAKDISTIVDAEKALVGDPNILAWASSEAATLCNKASKLHGEFAIDGELHATLHSELMDFSRRLTGSPAERLLIALEAVAHFESRLAEVQKGLAGHRERNAQMVNEARFAPLKAQMALTNEANRTAPLRLVLQQIGEATRTAEDALGSADITAIAEILENHLKEASAALRTLRNRKAA